MLTLDFCTFGWDERGSYVTLFHTLFQSFLDLEAGDAQFLKSQRRDPGSNHDRLLLKERVKPLNHYCS